MGVCGSNDAKKTESSFTYSLGIDSCHSNQFRLVSGVAARIEPQLWNNIVQGIYAIEQVEDQDETTQKLYQKYSRLHKIVVIATVILVILVCVVPMTFVFAHYTVGIALASLLVIDIIVGLVCYFKREQVIDTILKQRIHNIQQYFSRIMSIDSLKKVISLTIFKEIGGYQDWAKLCCYMYLPCVWIKPRMKITVRVFVSSDNRIRMPHGYNNFMMFVPDNNNNSNNNDASRVTTNADTGGGVAVPAVSAIPAVSSGGQIVIDSNGQQFVLMPMSSVSSAQLNNNMNLNNVNNMNNNSGEGEGEGEGGNVNGNVNNQAPTDVQIVYQ